MKNVKNIKTWGRKPKFVTSTKLPLQYYIFNIDTLILVTEIIVITELQYNFFMLKLRHVFVEGQSENLKTE